MRYKGKTVAFLTQHRKDKLLRSIFFERLGCDIIRAEGFDTDQLGTFTRDIPRYETQLATARTKALKSIELTDESIGLGSEGAFGPDPISGLISWNTEILVWIDTADNTEVIGVAQGAGCHQHSTVANLNQLLKYASSAQFPEHALIMRPDSADDSRVCKDLTTWPLLINTFEKLYAQSLNGHVFVEVDLRAHLNPTRQQMIVRAAENLIEKLQSLCPSCNRPGFSEKERVAGMPCALCRNPTRLPMMRIWRCDGCGAEEHRHMMVNEVADPSRCDVCNP
jgi:hypothetical protein